MAMCSLMVLLSLAALCAAAATDEQRFEKYMEGLDTNFRANLHPLYIPMVRYRDMAGDGSFDSTRMDAILNVTRPTETTSPREPSASFGEYVQHTHTMGYFEVLCLNGRPGGMFRRHWWMADRSDAAALLSGEWMTAKVAVGHFCGPDSLAMDRMGLSGATAKNVPDNKIFGITPGGRTLDLVTVVCPDGRELGVTLDPTVGLLTQLTDMCDCEQDQCLFFEGGPEVRRSALPFQVPDRFPWGFWTATGLPTVFHGLTLAEAVARTHAAVFPHADSKRKVTMVRLSNSFRCIGGLTERGLNTSGGGEDRAMKTTWMDHMVPHSAFFHPIQGRDLLLSAGIFGPRTDGGGFLDFSSSAQSDWMPSDTMFTRLLHHWSADQPPCSRAPITTSAWELHKHHTPKNTRETLLSIAGLKHVHHCRGPPPAVTSAEPSTLKILADLSMLTVTVILLVIGVVWLKRPIDVTVGVMVLFYLLTGLFTIRSPLVCLMLAAAVGVLLPTERFRAALGIRPIVHK